MTQADIGVPQQWSVDDTRGMDLHLSYRPNDALEIRSTTAYRDLDVEQYDNIAGAHRPAHACARRLGRFGRTSPARRDPRCDGHGPGSGSGQTAGSADRR